MELNMSKIDRTGEVFKTNMGGDCVVIKYVDAHNVTVMFLDSFKCVVRARIASLKRGEVKNPCARTICGVGYMGEGIYKSRVNGIKTKEYQAWENMIKRCYDGKFQDKNPTYLGCTVCDEWLNFQVFAEWYTKQQGSTLGYHLDKDLMVEGNKVYSAKTCCLIPQELNNLLLIKIKNTSGLPLGVYKKRGDNKYTSSLSCSNTNVYLGRFEDVGSAAQAYKLAKEAQVKTTTLMYKKTISVDVYNKLMSWSLEGVEYD